MIDFMNVSKHFGSLTALDNLNLHIDKGEIFGLLGPNGAGKTTMSHLTVGLLQPDSGQIRIGNNGNSSSAQSRKIIGVAPQKLSLYQELTAEENLAFFGKIQGLFGRKLKKRIDWALDFTGLSDRRKERISKYSGGMQRRLNLGVALLHDPELLILDEPTVGVDPQSRNVIFKRIEELKEKKRTIIYTTHYMEEAQRLCERVGILDHGKLLALDHIDALLRQHGGKDTLIVESNGKTIRRETTDAVKELHELQKEMTVENFRLDRPNLETVFLNLTGRKLRD